MADNPSAASELPKALRGPGEVGLVVQCLLVLRRRALLGGHGACRDDRPQYKADDAPNHGQSMSGLCLALGASQT